MQRSSPYEHYVGYCERVWDVAPPATPELYEKMVKTITESRYISEDMFIRAMGEIDGRGHGRNPAFGAWY